MYHRSNEMIPQQFLPCWSSMGQKHRLGVRGPMCFAGYAPSLRPANSRIEQPVLCLHTPEAARLSNQMPGSYAKLWSRTFRRCSLMRPGYILDNFTFATTIPMTDS